MDYRRDLLPPLLGLGLSLALHVALVGLDPRLFEQVPPHVTAPISVEYRQEPAETAPAAAGPAESPTPPPSPRPKPRAVPEPPPPPAPVAVERPAPRTLPAPPPPPPPEAASAPEPEAAPPAPQAPSAAAVPAPPAEATETDGPPPLRDLLPAPRDLEVFRTAEATPDPASGEAQEVTLALGDTDARYRGYLERVQGAIDRSEKWKEALLMAGRGGRVLVRFTIEAGGRLARVEVAESSGNRLLDDAAAEAVRRATLPDFPGHWRLDRLHLYAQFNYQLIGE